MLCNICCVLHYLNMIAFLETVRSGSVALANNPVLMEHQITLKELCEMHFNLISLHEVRTRFPPR